MEEEFELLALCMGTVKLNKIPNGRSLESLIDFNDKIRFDLSSLRQPLCLGEHEYLEPYVTSAIIATDLFCDSEYLYNYSNLEHAVITFSGQTVGYLDDRDITDFHLGIFNLPKLKTLKLDISALSPDQAEDMKISFRFSGTKIKVEFLESKRKSRLAMRKLQIS